MSVPEGLDLVTTPNGLRAVVRGPWRGEFHDYLFQQPIAEIELNQGKGWRGADVSFLSSFPRLRTLELLDLSIRDIAGVHALHELRELVLLTYSGTNIRFGEFPNLEYCALEWGKRRAESLFECKGLRHLSIGHYPGIDLTELGRLGRLESLWITTSPIKRQAGIERLHVLRELHLRGLRKLESLHGIEDLASLEELVVHTCRQVRSIAPVSGLVHLRKLHLNNDGDIESLNPLMALDGLEEVGFYESTNILDGDLSPLTRLPRLRLLAFQNRRHYSHRCEEFLAYREARHD